MRQSGALLTIILRAIQMSFITKTFQSDYIDLGDENYLHFVNIRSLDDNIIDCIDKHIVSICEGATSTDLITIKKRLIDFLTPKRGSTIEAGAIAEFFSHLFLNEIGFKQQFLFLNLEEGSIKKGFDGYYSRSGESWIFESKSGTISSTGITHQSKISEAYRDLKNKIIGISKNNPWRNAYNHASHIDVQSSSKIRADLKTLADEYTHGDAQDIRNFNIIPGSTIFLDGTWIEIDSDDLEIKLKALLQRFEFSKIHVICINKASIKLFWNYLEG